MKIRSDRWLIGFVPKLLMKSLVKITCLVQMHRFGAWQMLAGLHQ